MWKEKTGIMCVIVAGAKAGLWRTIRFKPAVRSTSIVTLNRPKTPPTPLGRRPQSAVGPELLP
ncbi:uncharacterized protein [Physcomitrium patens]|uniref:uncharacterized protein isoform X2 n=1 Tax=Physcomitrium patens TaxID=3218 RepID=UPI003CCD5FDE